MHEQENPKTPASDTVVGSPSPPSPPTESSQHEDTNGGQVLDDDGTDIRTLFAPAQGEGELGRLGHFRILKKLGAGGMGMVLLAEDINLLRPVALKIMLPKYARSAVAKDRFLREARTAAKIRHDHVVTVFHVGEDRGIPFMAMEFLKGAALDAYLKEKKAVSIPQAMRIVREACKGLQAAHALGLVHRDIKPANLWLEAPKGRVKLLDFGLARDASDEIKLTHTGAVLGTPAYMSPEQAAGTAVDQRTDLFSVGIVLYELLTGRLPFTGPSAMAVMHAIAYDPHPSIGAINPQVPAGLVKLVDRLLEKKPDDRQVSAGDVAGTLSGLERPAVRRDGKPVPEVVYVPMVTSAGPDPFADIDATTSELDGHAPVDRDAKSPGRSSPPDRAESRKRPGESAPTGRLRGPVRRRRPLYAAGGVAALAAVVFALLPGKRPDPSAGKEEPRQVAEKDTRKSAVKAIKKDDTPDAAVKVDGPKAVPLPPVKKVEEKPKNNVITELQPPVTKGAEATYDLGNGVKLEMIAISAKAKSFLMGSPGDEPARLTPSIAFGSDPEGQHKVTFARDFAVGKYEVTQEQYEAIMGTNPAHFKAAKNPVETVSWDDAQQFIQKLNERFKDRKVVFRLPSEAEWEYACRAGTTTAYNTGKTLTRDDACFGRKSEEGTMPVGSYKPNAFGLYDLHGNVYEWCEDYVGPYPNAPEDGGPQTVKQSDDVHVVRGNNWNGAVRDCRSALRSGSVTPFRVNYVGFRLAASFDEPGETQKSAPPPVTKGAETTYDLGNGVKLELVKINAKGKSFLMGSPKDEPERQSKSPTDIFGIDPEEQREVRFAHDFSIGKYEVTQEQYEAITGTNPARHKGPKRPVETVNWNEAQKFIAGLNAKFKDSSD